MVMQRGKWSSGAKGNLLHKSNVRGGADDLPLQKLVACGGGQEAELASFAESISSLRRTDKIDHKPKPFSRARD